MFKAIDQRQGVKAHGKDRPYAAYVQRKVTCQSPLREGISGANSNDGSLGANFEGNIGRINDRTLGNPFTQERGR